MCPLLPGPAQVTASGGGATVATTVAGLGAGSSGKQGLLRLGVSSYDYLGLIYDATLGKWVSQTQIVGYGQAAGTNTTTLQPIAAPVNANSVPVVGPLIPWKPMTDAGLSLQLRYIVIAYNQSGSTWRVQPCQFPLNAGDVGTNTYDALGAQINGTNSASPGVLAGDTDPSTWRDTTDTPKAFMQTGVVVTTTTAPANTNTFLNALTIMWRYIG